MLVLKCIYPKSIFAKCTTCVSSKLCEFTKCSNDQRKKKHFQQLLHIKCPFIEPGPTVRKYLLGPVELDGWGQSLACVPLTMVPGRIRAGQVASSGLPASIFLIGTNIIGRLMKGGSVSWPIGLVVCNVHHPD